MAVAYVLVLAVVSLGVPLALSLRDRVDAEVSSQARSQADVVAATVADSLSPPRRAELRRTATAAGRTVRGRVIVVDDRGRLLADSAGTTRLGTVYRGRPEIAAALAGRAFQGQRRSETLDEELLVTAVPVIGGGRTIGAVRVSQSMAAVRRAVNRTTGGLALVGGVVLLVGLAAGALIAAWIARPIRRLQDAAERVNEGDLEARAPVEGSSEQQALARSFNAMTDRLGRLLRSQQEFVADASHQLRTPLTGLRLRLEEADAVSSEAAVRDEIAAAISELDRMSATIDELLVLSRAGEPEGAAEMLDLGEVAERAAARWRPAAAEAGHELILRADGPASPFRAAFADVDRAVDALVENAVRYSPRGAPVTLVVSDGRLEVLDEGPGVDADEAERLFDRFHRGAAGRLGPPGTGLGLPIARELMRRWGGEAQIEPRPEGGARAALLAPPEHGSRR